MLRWALIFLVLALIAGALGAGGVAGLSMNIAYVLFVIFLILLVVHFVTGRGRLILREISPWKRPRPSGRGLFHVWSSACSIGPGSTGSGAVAGRRVS